MAHCIFNHIKLGLAAGLISISPITWAKLYTLEIKHRNSADIIQAITPLLEPNTKIQQFENKLIINTSPENFAALKQVIQDLDEPSTQLRIRVYQGNIAPPNSASLDDNQYELGAGSLEKDKRFIRSTSRENDRKTDEVLVLSGEMAFIQTEVTIPLLNSQYAYRDLSNANSNVNGLFTDNANAQLNQNKIQVPTSTGVRLIIPTPNQLQPGSTVLNIQVPTTTNLPLNIPNVPGQNLQLENTQSQSNRQTISQNTAQRNFNANRGASDQFYQYHQLPSGLFVRPIYIKGVNKVVIEVLTRSTQLEQPNQMNQKAYASFEVQTKLQIPLNKWVYIGGNRLDKPEASGYHYRTQAKEKEHQHLWVHVVRD